MSTEAETSASGSRVLLRGVERMVSVVDGVSTKIAHSMLVRGDTTTLLRYLPTAVMNTFNMHPRMRALQLKNQLLAAEIQAPITSHKLTNLMSVRMLRPSDYGDGSPTSWQAFVEKECSLGYDRHCQLPFYLSVWVAKRRGTVRLMLFSDQYMSDGFSGVVVLNCILEQVSMLARQTSEYQPLTVNEFPLRPSLYYLRLSTWTKSILKATNAIFVRRWFRNFTPLLPIRKDQKDFAIPPETNNTKALFADGDSKCMYEALAKCTKEGVTLNGVLVVVVLLAFYRVRSGKEQRGRFNPFRIAMDVDYNMRQEIQIENHVGMYTATTGLDWLTSEGVDMLTTHFWDLAGRASREIEANLKNIMAMALPMIVADQKLNAQMTPSFLKNVRIAHSITADVGVTELIQYPFEKHHSLTVSSDGEGDLIQSRHLDSMNSTPHVLSIESLHVFKAQPHLAPSATIFLSAVNTFSYSMAYKIEDDIGESLFTALVLIYESVGTIGTHENLMDVLSRLDE